MRLRVVARNTLWWPQRVSARDYPLSAASSLGVLCAAHCLFVRIRPDE